MSRPPLTIQDHKEAIRYFNSLIIDLIKREMDLEHEPITTERLEEAAGHIKDIRRCKRPAVRRAQGGEGVYCVDADCDLKLIGDDLLAALKAALLESEDEFWSRFWAFIQEQADANES